MHNFRSFLGVVTFDLIFPTHSSIGTRRTASEAFHDTHVPSEGDNTAYRNLLFFHIFHFVDHVLVSLSLCNHYQHLKEDPLHRNNRAKRRFSVCGLMCSYYCSRCSTPDDNPPVFKCFCSPVIYARSIYDWYLYNSLYLYV